MATAAPSRQVNQPAEIAALGQPECVFPCKSRLVRAVTGPVFADKMLGGGWAAVALGIFVILLGLVGAPLKEFYLFAFVGVFLICAGVGLFWQRFKTQPVSFAY